MSILFNYMEDFDKEQLSQWEKENGLATKICLYCNLELPRSNFAKHIKNIDNLDSRCMSCVKIGSDIRKKLHSIAPPKPEFCECCGEKPTKGNKLTLDHDHKTAEIRGWICNKCNTSIGKLGDTIQGLKKALTYLQSCKKAYNVRNIWVIKDEKN